MEILIWKTRYMLEMSKRTNCTLKRGWHLANNYVDRYNNWHEYTPVEAICHGVSR